MRDNDFQQLVDREFASLTWTDAQRLAALKQMHKEEHPVMKRKAFTALVLVISIMVVSAAALAVTVGIPTMQELIDQHRDRVPEESQYLFAPFTVDGAAVVPPENQRHTSRLVDVELHEAYITNEALYLTLHVSPIGENVVLWDDTAPPMKDGQELRYFDLYRKEGLTLLDFQGLSLHSPLNGYDYTVFADYTEVRRDPDGVGITCLMAYRLPEDDLIPLRSSTVMGKFAILDCHSREHEYNVLMFDLPRMTVVESTDDFLVN